MMRHEPPSAIFRPPLTPRAARCLARTRPDASFPATTSPAISPPHSPTLSPADVAQALPEIERVRAAPYPQLPARSFIKRPPRIRRSNGPSRRASTGERFASEVRDEVLYSPLGLCCGSQVGRVRRSAEPVCVACSPLAEQNRTLTRPSTSLRRSWWVEFRLLSTRPRRTKGGRRVSAIGDRG